MQNDLFGVVDLDSVKKQKRKSLAIHLILHKVCIGSEGNYQCRAIPYSPNFLNRKHWAVRDRWKKAWQQEVWACWQEEKKKWPEYQFPLDFKVRLTVSIFCIKPQDQDNALAAMKGVIDGLVYAKIVKNDTYEEITSEIQYVPVKTREAEHIELHITKYVRK